MAAKRVTPLASGTEAVPGFDIKRPIGGGGMANAYLAVQLRPNRVVALKVLSIAGQEALQGEDRHTLLDRFRREGEIVSGLEHSNIVHVYGVGTTDQLLYMYMEYLGGGDLASRIESGLHPFEALDILAALGDALDHAHSRGIVHRDIKPKNILFRRDGTPLISDFGIAKNYELADDITTLGMLLGSPIYMSPEQAEGRELDGRSDLYSLGVLLYEMLTGHPPFVASSPLRVMMMHAQAPVPALPEHLSRLQPLSDRLLAKDREDRFRSGQEVMRAAMALKRDIEADPDRYSAPASAPSAKDTLSGHTTNISDGLLDGLLEDLTHDRLVLPTPVAIGMLIEKQLGTGMQGRDALLGLIARDPACAVQILRAANATYYGTRGKVSSLEHALDLLGSQAEAQLAAIVSVSRAFESRLSSPFRLDLERLWKVATRASVLAAAVARMASLDERLAGLGGLMHNVGSLVLLVWVERIPLLAGSPQRVRRVFARIDRTVAASVLEQWQFPAELVRLVTECRSDYSPPEREKCELDAVAAAYRMAQHDYMSGFLQAGGMASPAVVKLGLEEADVLDLYQRLHQRQQ